MVPIGTYVINKYMIIKLFYFIFLIEATMPEEICFIEIPLILEKPLPNTLDLSLLKNITSSPGDISVDAS